MKKAVSALFLLAEKVGNLSSIHIVNSIFLKVITVEEIKDRHIAEEIISGNFFDCL